jgi:hypothetical protein
MTNRDLLVPEKKQQRLLHITQRFTLHPHIHAIASRGVWSSDGRFEAIPALDTTQLMLLFRHQVIKNLLAADLITQTTVDILDRFHHPGFSAYEGEGVPADDSAARERLSSYLVHAPFSLARLHYDRNAGIVTCESRSRSHSPLFSSSQQQFTPRDALAALTAFIPEKGHQLVRYYGFYSNKARGQRRRQNAAADPSPTPSCSDAVADDDFRRFSRRAWARLIRKVYLADPLTCPKCGGRLRILSFIENPSVIEKILRHLKLWDLPERSPPSGRSITMEPDADYIAWEAAARLFDDID